MNDRARLPLDTAMNLRLNTDVRAKIDDLAAKNHVTRSDTARALIDEALQRRRAKGQR